MKQSMKFAESDQVLTIRPMEITITDWEGTVVEQGLCFMDRWGRIIPNERARELITELETFYDSECKEFIEDHNDRINDELKREMIVDRD